MSLNQEERWLLQEKYGGEKSIAFFADLKRLASGEPLAYLIGHAPFLGLRVYLDSKPLIPRPETEYWAEKAIEAIRVRAEPAAGALHILDLCSGSGAIGLAVAKHCPDAQVTLADISAAHNAAIDRTIRENGIEKGRVRIVNGDLFEPVSGPFDFILANPPYIDPALDRAEASVKAHEPSLALYGGQGGLEIIERLLGAAPKYLAPQGQIWLEHEPEQTEVIQRLARQNGLSAITHQDQYHLDRFSIFQSEI